MKVRLWLLGVGLCMGSASHSARPAEPAPPDSLPPAAASPATPSQGQAGQPQPVPERLPAPGAVAPSPAAPGAAPSAQPNLPPTVPAGPYHLTLEEAKQRALASSKLLGLAAGNVQAKAYAVRAARADYFPKITGSAIYLHFNDELGTVLSGGGRTVSTLRGTPLFTVPTFAANVPVLNQNTYFSNINAVQPITDLLKVRQGVKIACADEQIAQAQLEKGTRQLVSGVEQLYWGLLAARRIRAGAAEGVQGAELLAKTKTLEARVALLEARQALQQVDKQIADLQEQLNGLLDLPPCTALELVEPPLPVPEFRCADDVIGLALAASPEVREAQQTIAKAQAAVAAGKLDYVPSIAAVGGYVNQSAASYVQPNIGYIGVVGTYTFIDWGKRRNTIRERQELESLANLKLRQTEDEVRQKAQKAFRDVLASQEAQKTAQEMVELRKEGEKQARGPAELMAAAKARMLAEVDAIKADLAYRQAYGELMTLVGK